MKKFRKKIEKFVKGFRSGNQKQYCEAILLAHYWLIECIFLIITYIYFFILNILKIYNLQRYIVIAIVLMIIPIFFYFSKKISKILLGYTSPIVTKIVFFFGKNGNVISKRDWKAIKKKTPQLYNDLWKSNKSEGHCYYYSRELAMQIEESLLLYLSIKKEDEYISHAVVVKDGCVFDTNIKIHFELDEYIRLNKGVVYKMFSREEFEKDDFFENIRPKLMDYCKEHGVYCVPE